MEGQRQPTPHPTALTPSSFLPCFPLGEPTRNPRAEEPKRGREWICGERETNGKTIYLEEGGSKRGKETVRKWQIAHQAVFWVKKKRDEGGTAVSSKGVF